MTIQVRVGYREGVGFESVANHKITRSFTAPDLNTMHRRLVVAAALQRRQPVAVQMVLDGSAQAEAERNGWAAAGV